MGKSITMEAASYSRFSLRGCYSFVFLPLWQSLGAVAVLAQHQSFSPCVKWHMWMGVLRRTAKVCTSGTSTVTEQINQEKDPPTSP